MAEEKQEGLNAVIKEEKAEKKAKDKKNTFTLIYILVGIFIIAILALFIFAYMMSR